MDGRTDLADPFYKVIGDDLKIWKFRNHTKIGNIGIQIEPWKSSEDKISTGGTLRLVGPNIDLNWGI